MNSSLYQELAEIACLLKTYRVYDDKGPIALRRLGKDYDGGYVVPEKAITAADVIMGYGISDDSSFEEMASEIYGKRSYGFDGSVALDKIAHPLFHFAPIYIIEDEKMRDLGGVPTKYSSFDEHLKIFHLQDKKIFVKMDIEYNEYLNMPDVLRHSSQVTGITFELHFLADEYIPKALNLLRQFQKDYLLVHVHGHNLFKRFQAPNAKGAIPQLLELSYIHKNLVSRFDLSENQSHPTLLDMPSDPKHPECYFEILV